MKLVNSKDLAFSSFLAGLLEPDPTLRLTPVQALRHEFLAPLFPFRYALDAGEPASSYPLLPEFPKATVCFPCCRCRCCIGTTPALHSPPHRALPALRAAGGKHIAQVHSSARDCSQRGTNASGLRTVSTGGRRDQATG